MSKKTPPTPPANRGQGRKKLAFKTRRVIFHLEENQARNLDASPNKSAFARDLFSKNGFPFGEPIEI